MFHFIFEVFISLFQGACFSKLIQVKHFGVVLLDTSLHRILYFLFDLNHPFFFLVTFLDFQWFSRILEFIAGHVFDFLLDFCFGILIIKVTLKFHCCLLGEDLYLFCIFFLLISSILLVLGFLIHKVIFVLEVKYFSLLVFDTMYFWNLSFI